MTPDPSQTKPIDDLDAFLLQGEPMLNEATSPASPPKRSDADLPAFIRAAEAALQAAKDEASLERARAMLRPSL